MTLSRGYPFYSILITISVFAPSSPANTDRQVATDNKSAFPSPFVTPFEDGSINVPISMCDSVEQKRYADLTTAYLDPPCEQTFDGFCGIRRNQNYTLIAKFLSKVQTKALSVRVTTIDAWSGFETQFWPEFSVCTSQFNITCPQNPNNLVQAYLHESLPKEVPPMRALVRVRLLGSDESNIKRVYICRQINIQVY
ncbi:hypothetical protein Ocin01_16606 [Orchesella cincta]|uniref:MD-2-related lipid-recognition domain-containing protein n=1 Tax=Orchesella cincta TaxID=48709 RepID=A0A1D2MAR1_ORCCI|nr:hypothetical protein Ocin01_16606 [Orchesella cincta]